MATKSYVIPGFNARQGDAFVLAMATALPEGVTLTELLLRYMAANGPVWREPITEIDPHWMATHPGQAYQGPDGIVHEFPHDQPQGQDTGCRGGHQGKGSPCDAVAPSAGDRVTRWRYVGSVGPPSWDADEDAIRTLARAGTERARVWLAANEGDRAVQQSLSWYITELVDGTEPESRQPEQLEELRAAIESATRRSAAIDESHVYLLLGNRDHRLKVYPVRPESPAQVQVWARRDGAGELCDTLAVQAAPLREAGIDLRRVSPMRADQSEHKLAVERAPETTTAEIDWLVETSRAVLEWVEPLMNNSEQLGEQGNGASGGDPATPGRPTADLLSRWLRSEGLVYEPRTVALFLTALQTKGFVILGGPSGTGKTKLAQAIVGLMGPGDGERNHEFMAVRPDWRDSKSVLGYYNPILERYEATPLLRLVLRAREGEGAAPEDRLWDALQDPERIAWGTGAVELYERLSALPVAEWTSDDLHIVWQEKRNPIADAGQSFPLTVSEDVQREIAGLLCDRSKSLGRRVLGALKQFREAGERRQPKLRVMRTLAALNLPEVSTTADINRLTSAARLLGYDGPRLHKLIADEDEEGINRLLEAVREGVARRLPSSAALGARATAPWVMLLIEEEDLPATSDFANPNFVILDEMNLARVEYYFADFLSVLESGREPNGLTRESVRVHDRPVAEPIVDESSGLTIPASLHLPPNLYVIGTINVDETTHAVSPKVLDRSFTIEIRDVRFGSLASVDPVEVDREALVSAFTHGSLFAQIDRDVIASLDHREPRLRQWLQRLTSTLESHDLDFAYRTYDEIMMFTANAERAPWFDGFGNSVLAAFDDACLCKILPKFAGTRGRLRVPLQKVLAWAVDPEASDLSSAAEPVDAVVDLSGAVLPRLAYKAKKMLTRLEEEGFASFA